MSSDDAKQAPCPWHDPNVANLSAHCFVAVTGGKRHDFHRWLTSRKADHALGGFTRAFFGRHDFPGRLIMKSRADENLKPICVQYIPRHTTEVKNGIGSINVVGARDLDELKETVNQLQQALSKSGTFNIQFEDVRIQQTVFVVQPNDSIRMDLTSLVQQMPSFKWGKAKLYIHRPGLAISWNGSHRFTAEGAPDVAVKRWKDDVAPLLMPFVQQIEEQL